MSDTRSGIFFLASLNLAFSMQVRIIFIQYSCHGYLLNINLVPTLFQTGEAAVNKAGKGPVLIRGWGSSGNRYETVYKQKIQYIN